MRLGLFMMPLHTLKLGYKAMYDQDVEAALLAERLGYDEFWIGEHVAAKVEPVSSALQFLSAIAYQTKTIKLCTGVVNLPQHHPARVCRRCCHVGPHVRRPAHPGDRAGRPCLRLRALPDRRQEPPGDDVGKCRHYSRHLGKGVRPTTSRANTGRSRSLIPSSLTWASGRCRRRSRRPFRPSALLR